MNDDKCPNCGNDTIWYHESGISRCICAKQCSGWEVIKEIDWIKRKVKEFSNENPELNEL